MLPNLPPFQVSWPYDRFLVSPRPVTPVNPALSLPAILPGGDPVWNATCQATPLTCLKLSLRDLAQLGQSRIAGFMPVQLGKRVLA